MKRGETPPTGVAWNEDKNLFLDKEDRIWIPPSATDLQQRVCIIAHQRHRGPSTNRSHDQGRPRCLRLEHPRSRCQDQACIHCLNKDQEEVKKMAAELEKTLRHSL
ncbi:hypothetical protein DYB28_008600 [Aphanomyces astaci]|uniref:Uncharacterized protein n=1 Tax=Aphanomyces astaci TaxID=112090 RepID=A0A9X8E037_APHAT|nr:hypothetical protein DYB28_008600 [Aphanomyces astaci]